MEENKGGSLFKTLAIITTIFAGIIAVVAVAVRLYSKYCLLNEPVEDEEADDELFPEEADESDGSDEPAGADE